MTRSFLIALAWSAPQFFLVHLAAAGDASNCNLPCTGEARIVVTTSADGDDAAGEHAVWVVADGEGMADGNVQVDPIVIKRIAGDDGEAKVMVTARAVATPEADKSHGWLGVSVGIVPDALSAQLGPEARGSIILNVVKDSPADKAGLAVHDVVVAIAGEKIEGDASGVAAQVAKLVGSHKPGETISVSVLREGQQREFQATLGERPLMHTFEWKHAMPPGAQIDDKTRIRGKMMQLGPGGNWVLRDLGDLKQLQGLTGENLMFIPEPGERCIKVFMDGGERRVEASVERDGIRIDVRQVDDGAITVTRTDAAGAETTKEYASVDELRAADAEAADVFDQTSASVTVKVDGADLDGDFDFNIELQGLDEQLGDLHEKFADGFREAQEAYHSAMQEYHKAFEDAMQQWNAGGDNDGRSEPGIANLPPMPKFSGMMVQSKPRQSFEVRPDGTIEVRVRKGDSELVRLYANESDFAAQDPKNYARYQELSADND